MLAVYAVKTNTDPDNPQDVASMDDSKKALLKEIFWTMHTVSYTTAVETRDIVTETYDGNGDGQIVEVAFAQIGNSGDIYWSWYGFDSRVE